jgi:hypothetical protein
VGEYDGNGNANGVFVYTGFRPAFILYKHTSVGENWWMHDSERLGYNPNNWSSAPNSNQAEVTSGGYIDILSNGFKFRGTEIQINASGETYIYMAFAESPFVNSKGAPTNAR